MKQLVAEQLVTVRTKRGFQRLEWQKLRERNEALDCRVYARAAAWLVGRGPLGRREVARPRGPGRRRAGRGSPIAAGQINRTRVYYARTGASGKRRSDWLGRRQGMVLK